MTFCKIISGKQIEIEKQINEVLKNSQYLDIKVIGTDEFDQPILLLFVTNGDSKSNRVSDSNLRLNKDKLGISNI